MVLWFSITSKHRIRHVLNLIPVCQRVSRRVCCISLTALLPVMAILLKMYGLMVQTAEVMVLQPNNRLKSARKRSTILLKRERFLLR